MIKVIIVDDELPARLRVHKMIADFPQRLEFLGEADCGKDAIQLIETLRPDAVFLDIQMPDMTGFEMINQLSYQPMIIFTTAYAEHAIKAFETVSVDYLVKPFDKDRFQKAIEKLTRFTPPTPTDEYQQLANLLQQTKSKKSLALPIKKKDKIILVEFENISHFKAEDKYVNVTLKDGVQHLLTKSIAQLEQDLPDQFIRVHRSYIVNRSYIFEIQKYFKGRLALKLKDNNHTTITTGETYTSKVKEVLGL